MWTSLTPDISNARNNAEKPVEIIKPSSSYVHKAAEQQVQHNQEVEGLSIDQRLFSNSTVSNKNQNAFDIQHGLAVGEDPTDNNHQESSDEEQNSVQFGKRIIKLEAELVLVRDALNKASYRIGDQIIDSDDDPILSENEYQFENQVNTREYQRDRMFGAAYYFITNVITGIHFSHECNFDNEMFTTLICF